MKNVTTLLLFYLVCFLSLLTFFGCGDTEDTEETATSYLMGEQTEKTDDEIKIPDNWYKVRDPLERNEYFRAILIKQFGDIPEVHTIAEYQRKRIQGLHVTVTAISTET